MNTAKRALIVDCDHASIDIERAVLKDVCPDLPWLTCKTEDEVIAQCGGAEALLIQYAPMTERVLKSLPDLKIIVRYGVGVDTIDLKAAAKLGIIASNVPDYGTDEVSDHALGLYLALSRKIIKSNHLIREGIWDFREVRPVHRHQILTMGVIGLGRIGGAFAKKAHGIGMNIIAYDPTHGDQAIPDYVKMVGLDELLATSDAVSVHCPLNQSTKDLLDEKHLRMMKSTAYLINTARGSIVNEVALEKMLSEGKLAGAALDVFSKEPAPTNHPLLKFGNFICTPHMAWHSEESAIELKRKAAEEARRILLGEAPLYRMN